MKIETGVGNQYYFLVQNNQAIFTQNILILLNVEKLDCVGLGDVFHTQNTASRPFAGKILAVLYVLSTVGVT